MRGRLYSSLTSLVLVLTLLARPTISMTCQQLITISKNSAILGSWNNSAMNQTFSFILLFLLFLLEPFPSAFPLQLSYPPQRAVPQQPSTDVHQLMASCPPAQPPSGSIPPCWRISASFKTACPCQAAEHMKCSSEDQLQGSTQLQAECHWFQMWFCCCCCSPYFNTWTVQFYLHLWKEQPERPTDVNYYNHTPLV